MTTLEVDRLGKRFGPAVAVRELSLVVEPGSVMSLVGPNGAGKTTAMECIASILRPDVVTIRVDGASPSKRAVGYAAQKVGLYPSRTVRRT